ncbi:MAG: bifunctional serine/threonine-protein kinase/formylglycine-generating enzyme family protein [Planctomycetes bacterium]|nr:bifunctional serine/threonine-protein kinase/formylglycine-generating enzyme family protein [Planctomycetota bacterium]
MDESRPNSDRSVAEELFAERFDDLEAGVSGVLEDLCAAHPEHAELFRELYASWQRAQQILGAGAPAQPTLSADLSALLKGAVRADEEGGSKAESAQSGDALMQLQDRLDPERRLEVQGEMARGGMGAVLSVFDRNLRRQMAMKVMLKQEELEGPLSAGPMGRFLDEAQITGQLEHPGIVPVHELGIDPDGRVYFTMKLVQGEELADVFRRAWEREEGWSTTRVLSLFLRVCEAMSYAHSRGVIHRDLKPANVMVGAFGEVYVMDWGLARIQGQEDSAAGELAPAEMSEVVRSDRQDLRDELPDSSILTVEGSIMGTPAFMPPEQARGEIDEMDERSDVYAVGAMLYELLSGYKPYVTAEGRPNLMNFLMLIQEGPPVPIHEHFPDVVPELEAICEKAMQRDKRERYASMAELADDLRNYLEGRVVKAYETGAVAELKKWVRRNRGLANSLAAGVLVLIAGVVVSTYFWRDASQQAMSVLRLGDARDLGGLWEEARELWPANEETAPEMAAWIQRAEVLLARLPEHRQVHKELSAEALPRTPEEVISDRENHRLAASLEQFKAVLPPIEEAIAADPESEDAEYWRGKLKEYKAYIETTEAEVNERATYNFEDQSKGWWHEALTQLIQDLELLETQGYWSNQDLDLGFVTGVQEMSRRLEDAEALAGESVKGEEVGRVWEEALRSISDEEECPMYGGMQLTPQLGLLPVGRDPDSGLWEFTHVQSRAGSRVPSRDPESSELKLDMGDGLTFVLIPGGTFLMGAQADDPSAPNFDPAATPEEGPVHEVELAPFFLSKYEMTQEQFARTGHERPSLYKGGTKVGLDPTTGEVMDQISKLNPVESVTWEESAYVCRTLDLTLPTEAQWEYAARAGTSTPWWTGADGASLEGAENLGDQATQVIGMPAWTYEAWDDGHPVHCPVNAMRPNPWGLHQILGNVGEWTREVYKPGYPDAPTGPEGWHTTEELKPNETYTIRGPGWFRTRVGYRVSARYQGNQKDYKTEHFGLRPVRVVR